MRQLVREQGSYIRHRGHDGRVRRAMIIMASAPGTLVPAIARLVAAGARSWPAH
jgi:hypothetical protein